jgi:hypothetical protein
MKQRLNSTLPHKETLSFSESHHDSYEPIIKKYKAISLEQALRRAVASVVNESGLKDIKYLLETCKVSMHSASESGKMPLEICMDYAFNKLYAPFDHKQALRAKLKAISYLLTKNESNDALPPAIKTFTAFYQRYLEKNSDEGTSPQTEMGFAFLFTLSDLLNKAQYNLGLQKKWEKYASCKHYSFQPILLCENHLDAGSCLFAKHLLPELKKIGYQIVGVEYYQDFELNHCLNIAQKKSVQYKEQFTPDGRMINENNITLFQTLKEQNLLFKTIDINKYIEHKGAKHLEQIAYREYGLELCKPLRDKGMFYNLAILAAQYDGAVIGIVGFCHGLPIINHFIQQGMSPTEWLKVIPYEDPSLIGIGRHLLLNEDGNVMHETRTLLEQGAIGLCLDKDSLLNSSTQFLETVRQELSSMLMPRS